MSNFTPAWFKKGFFNESLFCDDFLSTHQLLYSNGAFFTPDGRMVDPMPLRCEIFEMMREYVGAKHTLKALIRKVSVRASEFQSHSKQSGDTTSSAEDDSAKIAQDAVNEIKQDTSQNSPVSGGDSGAIDVSLDQDWGNW